MVFDVDGVLTDGRLWYGADGEVLKSFHTLDGHGLRLLARARIHTAILSGRESAAVARRAAELGIREVLQGVERKGEAFEALLARLRCAAHEAAYMGDDVVDLPVLRCCGLACAPREAHPRVLDCAHFVAQAPAGAGAAREACEFVLRARGLEQLIEDPL
jgi:3-deoxy-D-manno-octulosonate 8-phosphate phosphatase (KDO 8-P phosphatase)